MAGSAWTNQVQNIVVITGTNGGVFVYSGTPGPGNPPVYWITNGGLKDPFGNTLPAIQGSMANFGGGLWQAFSTANGFLQWYFSTTGPTGPWTNAASIVAGNNLNGDLAISSNPGTLAQITEIYLGIAQAVISNPTAIGNVTGVSFEVGKGWTVQNNQSDETWHTLSLTTVTASGNGVNGFRYKLMPINCLLLEWDINTNSVGNAVTIATLPAGWRPAVAHNIGSSTYGGTVSLTTAVNPHFTVNTNGTIVTGATGANAFSMCGTALIAMD